MSDNEILKDCGCECGCSAEIGTIIHENDTLFKFVIKGHDADDVLKSYVESAKQACSEVKIITNTSLNSDGEKVIEGNFEFSCTAEKLIFQLRSGAQEA